MLASNSHMKAGPPRLTKSGRLTLSVKAEEK